MTAITPKAAGHASNGAADTPASAPAMAARAVDAEPVPSSSLDSTTRESETPGRAEDGWLAHRTLIRASLPRSENEPPAPRPVRTPRPRPQVPVASDEPLQQVETRTSHGDSGA